MVWVLTVKIYFKLFTGHFSKTNPKNLSHSFCFWLNKTRTNMLCTAAKQWVLSGNISPVFSSSRGYIAMLCRFMLRKKLVGALRRWNNVIYGCKHHYWGWNVKLEYYQLNISNTLLTDWGFNTISHCIWQYKAQPLLASLFIWQLVDISLCSTRVERYTVRVVLYEETFHLLSVFY